MYWATRVWMTIQPAQTTSTVMKLFSRTNSSEIPSMPSR